MEMIWTDSDLSSNPQTSSEHGCAILNHIHPSPWPLRSLILSRNILNIHGALFGAERGITSNCSVVVDFSILSIEENSL